MSYVSSFKQGIRIVSEKVGVFLLSLLGFLAALSILGKLVSLDGYTVSGDAITIASAVLVGAVLVSDPLCTRCEET